MCLLVSTKTGCIVTTHFINTCSMRSGTIELTNDNVRIGRETTFEVRTYRSYEHYKHILFSRMYTYLGTCSDQQRTDVKRSTSFIRRDKTFIQFYDFQDCFFKPFCRKFCHQDSLASRLQTGSVFFQTENTYFTIFSTECFQSFKSFLTIM